MILIVVASTPSPLELAALDLALSSGGDWAESLRQQIPMLRVTKRERTDVGLWVEFRVEGDCSPVTIPSSVSEHPPAVLVRHQSMPDLGDFLVWTKEGFITALEGTAHGDGRWPGNERLEDFQLFPQRVGIPPD